MITEDTITEDQIRALRIFAVQRFEHLTAAVCAVAQADEFSEPTLDRLSRPERLAIYAMTAGEARRRCAQILSSARCDCGGAFYGVDHHSLCSVSLSR